jgi:peptidoglycan/xylan/chitin deacetylase (PgdA/CDA1 family)
VDWIWNELTTEAGLFEKQLGLLKARGFRTVSLDAYRELQETSGYTPGQDVVLTFDDGYLDNWVYAYPLLKRQGMVGSIYVNPEFIDPGEEPRPNLEDVWAGRISESDLESVGFLNRGELRLMQKSGVMTIASHSMSHTWYPVAPEIVDFHRPGLDTHWLAWNAKPERKFAYLTEDQSGFVPFGHPIYAHGRSLGIRRFLPDSDAADAAIAWVDSHGGAKVFSRPEWKNELIKETAPFTEKGRFETDEEMSARYRDEIFRSTAILEDIIGAKVKHFCWPGGAYNNDSWAIAEEAGFATICVTRRDAERWTRDDPSLVRRVGCGNLFSFLGRQYATDNPGFLLDECDIAMGNNGARWPNRWRKLAGAARAGFKSRK